MDCLPAQPGHHCPACCGECASALQDELRYCPPTCEATESGVIIHDHGDRLADPFEQRYERAAVAEAAERNHSYNPAEAAQRIEGGWMSGPCSRDHNCSPECSSPCPYDDDDPRGWLG